MVLKFHMQHDQTLRLQNDKIPLGRESKMAANAKNSKTDKINFFFNQNGMVYLADILYEALMGPCFKNYRIEKNGCRIR